MKTGSWIEQEHCIWKVLPLHPPPEVLESLTSYITRLVSANGFQSLDELGRLVGERSAFRMRSPDYPTFVSPGLAQVANVPAARWLDMTFFYLVQRFGRSTHPSALHKFLAGSISPVLRYCPRCLAEHNPAYYSLLWRFLTLPGCIEHRVSFLDQCCHCGSPLPLLIPIPQLTTCPTCRGDLGKGVSSLLESGVLELTTRRTNDLKMLLTPGSRPPEKDQARIIGKRFQLLRLKRGHLIAEVASLMGRETSTVLHIDLVRKLKQACLNDYMRYADILGYSLSEIFNATSLQDLFVLKSEELPLDQIGGAMLRFYSSYVNSLDAEDISCEIT